MVKRKSFLLREYRSTLFDHFQVITFRWGEEGGLPKQSLLLLSSFVSAFYEFPCEVIAWWDPIRLSLSLYLSPSSAIINPSEHAAVALLKGTLLTAKSWVTNLLIRGYVLESGKGASVPNSCRVCWHFQQFLSLLINIKQSSIKTAVWVHINCGLSLFEVFWKKMTRKIFL